MCVNYLPPKREQFEYFGVQPPDDNWRDEVWQDYTAPIILVGADGGREARLATYSMVQISNSAEKKLRSSRP